MATFSRFRFIFYCGLAGFLSACAKEAPPAQEAPPPTVEVTTVTAQPVTLTRKLPGRTRSFLVAEVRPQVTGVVEERLFEEGAFVEEGETLYQLDDSIYRADVASARASVARAEASLELARLRADRVVGLFEESNAVSQKERDDAVAALHEAEADLELAQSKLESAEVMLGYSRITAPISGHIGRSSVTQGALVTQNQPEALATIQQLDPIYVDVSHSAREMLDLRRAIAAGELEESGLTATILLEDGTEYKEKGRIAFSEVSVDPTTGSFILRIILPNPDRMLLPGMYVRAVIGEGTREEAILVPQKAVIRDPSGHTSVMIVGDNNVVEGRAIQVRRSVGNDWLVDAGLLEGDRVITAGLQKIQPGIEVNIAQAAEEEPTETESTNE